MSDNAICAGCRHDHRNDEGRQTVLCAHPTCNVPDPFVAGLKRAQRPWWYEPVCPFVEPTEEGAS